MAQVTQTIDVTTPGSLNTALGSQKNQITDLTLTGTLNAADFQTIREMQAIKNLNLSMANVVDNTLPNKAFEKKMLHELQLPNTLIAIGKNAFELARLDGRFKIPNSVEIIDDAAFKDCSFSNRLTCYNPVPPTLGSNVFLGVNTSTCVLEVPCKAVDLYSNAAQWSSFSDINLSCIKPINVPNSVPLVYNDGASYSKSTTGVRVGEYYWTNSNIWLNGYTNQDITQAQVDYGHFYQEMFGNRQTCPNPWDNPDLSYWSYEGVTLDLFKQYYGPYYPRNVWAYMQSRLDWTEDGNAQIEGWRLPNPEDALQLVGMCGNGQPKVVRQYLSQPYLDETAPAFVNKIATNAYYDWFRPLEHELQNEQWYYSTENTNKYGFNMIPGGQRSHANDNVNTENYRCVNGTTESYRTSYPIVQGDFIGLNQTHSVYL